MKKILFIIPAFNLGGTNKVLENMISCMDNNLYTIDLFVLSHIGPYKNKFPNKIVLKRSLELSSILDSYNSIKNEPFFEKSVKILLKTLYRILQVFTGKNLLTRLYIKEAKKIEKMNYDTIIAMQEGRATQFASHINEKKVAWIHSDYSEYIKIVKENEEGIYNKFNDIVCVSDYTKNVFVNHYPSLKRKIHGIHNMIDYKTIIEQSNDITNFDNRFNFNQFTIISVGRLTKVKQFNIIPQIANDLRALGCQFKWYIIGSGEEQNKVSDEIERYKVSDIVILLGEKANPYPYIKKSDVLVSTSLSEACPNVINEAKVLHVPVVTTNFGSAPEFINNGENGIITDKDNLKSTLELIIKDKEEYGRLKRNLNSFKYSNENIIFKITNLL